jgi:hypothetical protein
MIIEFSFHQRNQFSVDASIFPHFIYQLKIEVCTLELLFYISIISLLYIFYIAIIMKMEAENYQTSNADAKPTIDFRLCA